MTAAFFTGADTPTEVPLKRRLKRAERGRQFKALALVLPLLLFLLFTFVGPLAGMLWRFRSWPGRVPTGDCSSTRPQPASPSP